MSKKRQEIGVANIKAYSLDHDHILSGLIKCPVCDSGMYIDANEQTATEPINKGFVAV